MSPLRELQRAEDVAKRKNHRCGQFCSVNCTSTHATLPAKSNMHTWHTGIGAYANAHLDNSTFRLAHNVTLLVASLVFIHPMYGRRTSRSSFLDGIWSTTCARPSADDRHRGSERLSLGPRYTASGSYQGGSPWQHHDAQAAQPAQRKKSNARDRQAPKLSHILRVYSLNSSVCVCRNFPRLSRYWWRQVPWIVSLNSLVVYSWVLVRLCR